MPQQNQQASPFEIVTPGKSKKGGGKGIIIGVAIVIFLILSVVAGVLLVRQRQNIQEKASVTMCPGAEACPNASQPTLLQSCHPADTDNSTNDSNCNAAGRVETCGPATTQYCCPAPGAAWTTDMTVCNSLNATPSPSPSPSPTVSPSPSPTAAPNTCGGSCGSNSNCDSGLICSNGSCRNPLCTSASDCVCNSSTSPTPTSTTTTTTTTAPTTQSSPLPVPVTGIDWPTGVGVGVGAAAIILSILIAL